jgi:hypothetical protein
MILMIASSMIRSALGLVPVDSISNTASGRSSCHLCIRFLQFGASIAEHPPKSNAGGKVENPMAI